MIRSKGFGTALALLGLSLSGCKDDGDDETDLVVEIRNEGTSDRRPTILPLEVDLEEWTWTTNPKIETSRSSPPAAGCHGLSSTRVPSAWPRPHGLKTTRGTLISTKPLSPKSVRSFFGGVERGVSK